MRISSLMLAINVNEEKGLSPITGGHEAHTFMHSQVINIFLYVGKKMHSALLPGRLGDLALIS